MSISRSLIYLIFLFSVLVNQTVVAVNQSEVAANQAEVIAVNQAEIVAVNQAAVADDQADDDWLNRIASKRSMFFASWTGLGELNPDGNPTEKWLAQPEFQLALKQLLSAIELYQEIHPVPDPALNELVLKTPTLIKDCPASFSFGFEDAKEDKEPTPFMVAIIQLKQHEEWASGIMKTLVETDRKQALADRIVDGDTFFVKKMDDDDAKMHVGIMKGHLIMTIGVDAFDNMLADLKTPAPQWMEQSRQETNIDRALAFFHFDPAELFKMNQRTGRESQIPQSLRLEAIQSVSGSLGLDKEGFVVSLFVRSPESAKGLMGMAASEGIDKSFILEIPDGEMTSAGVRLSLPTLMEVIQEFAVDLGEDSFNDAILTIEETTNMDFEKEIVGSFDGLVTSYQSFSPLSMGTSGVIALKIKEPEVFATRLAKFNKELAGEIEALGLGEFEEKESKGQSIYSFVRPLYAGQSISWCHVDNQLYVSGDVKSISTHLRKRGRTKNRLIDNPRFKKSFEYGQSRGWGNPVAFSHVDVATIIELLVPIGQTFLAGQEIPDFDFTIEDIPSVDVLVKGVEANEIVVFRSKEGIHLIERSTLPAGSSVATTGIAIGMLFPAVQQVRHAARRVKTINNLRQLQLALLNYEAVHREYPPAYSTDENGKPLLSWRVHILPFMEEQELYEQFHLDEPWDSPHNKTLIAKMPAAYENLAVSVDAGQTTFLGVGGKNGVLSGIEGIKLASVTDGTSNTISILDVNSENAVTWTAPSDFNPDEVEDIASAISGNWRGIQAIAVLVDGSVQSLSGYSNEELKNMMNRSDDAIIEWNDQ